jgi:hypothetical protein
MKKHQIFLFVCGVSAINFVSALGEENEALNFGWCAGIIIGSAISLMACSFFGDCSKPGKEVAK